MKKKYLLFLLFGFITCLYCGTDATIATVGKRIIWQNDVKERAQTRGISFEEALLQLIEENLLIIQAKKENISVSKEEIDNRLDLIVNEWKKRNVDFLSFIKENGLTVNQYREILADQIRSEKLVAQKIYSGIHISPVEIADRMSKMPKEKQIFLLRKTFDDITSAETFVSKIRENKSAISEMDSTGWISVSKIDPSLLSQLLEAGKDKPVIVKSSEKFIVYLVYEIRDNTPEQLYKIARQEIYQEKVNTAYREYINKLLQSIPVKIFDESISKKIFTNYNQ